MDPIGFALENFDLVGAWRETDGPGPIDASGQLADGTPLKGPADLRRAHREPQRRVPHAGHGEAADLRDGPARGRYGHVAVRAIVRRLNQDGNRFSALVVAVTQSAPFRMRVKKA